ncbi:MAG: hypothetical protein HYX68_06330 [Planctomycetes bacterium]|nr:hypothetical protein [Planctomycetota bacterium]
MGTSRWILRLAGTLLLAAAALKAWGLGLEPVARLGVLSTAEAQLTIIALELFLGLWLWIGAGGGECARPLACGCSDVHRFCLCHVLPGLGRPIVVRLFGPLFAEPQVRVRPGRVRAGGFGHGLS